jgi:hypothetical protein
MAYCTVDDLAAALRIRVTAANTALLQRCVDAAAAEIDTGLDRFVDEPIAVAPDSDPLVASDNVFRAVQWFKANDVALGGGGYSETGLLTAPAVAFVPTSERPYRQQWGLA